jgi:hypothetical protein
MLAATSATVLFKQIGKAAAEPGKPEDLPVSKNAFGNKSDGFIT